MLGAASRLSAWRRFAMRSGEVLCGSVLVKKFLQPRVIIIFFLCDLTCVCYSRISSYATCTFDSVLYVVFVVFSPSLLPRAAEWTWTPSLVTPSSLPWRKTIGDLASRE